MFIAGSVTVQTTTSNLIISMLHEPECFSKLKKEIDTFMDEIKDDIMGKMTLAEVDELDYVKMSY